MIWVTGAAGSIGSALVTGDRIGTDLEVDVTDQTAVDRFNYEYAPELVLHCAGAKHAPEGEADPEHVSRVNITGTRNIIETGARVVLTSTCKAANPQTAYGASKLIAERMVLNAGGSVVRFYNVIQTQGNVFDIWSHTEGPLPVTECWRYFITLEDAVGLVEEAKDLPSGRYTVDPGEPVFIPDLADELYPDRTKRMVAPRRGDRIREPLLADCETRVQLSDRVWRIISSHDPYR